MWVRFPPCSPDLSGEVLLFVGPVSWKQLEELSKYKELIGTHDIGKLLEDCDEHRSHIDSLKLALQAEKHNAIKANKHIEGLHQELEIVRDRYNRVEKARLELEQERKAINDYILTLDPPEGL